MKKILCVLLISFSLNSFSQISYEKGYFIDVFQKKIDCLIKDIDWKNNPDSFQYKLSENDEPKTATINIVSEFGMYGGSKYVRKTVKFDRGLIDWNNITKNRNPEYTEKQIFIKFLVEGKANLYIYEDSDSKKFFFDVDNGITEQLIYKKYLTNLDKPGINIGTNNYYKQQLINNLICDGLNTISFEDIEYFADDLSTVFHNYNKCFGEKSTNYTKTLKKDLFNLSIRPGLNSSSFSLENDLSNPIETKFDNQLNFRFGIEAEFTFPFNKNKWAFIVEPTYQYYKSEKTLSSNSTIVVDYKSIELPFGIRHYFYLNDHSKLFLNGSFVLNVDLKSNIFIDSVSVFEIDTGNSLAFGFGYKHKNKYSLELRYHTSRNIISDYYRIYRTTYNSLSVIFGYTLF